MNYGTDLVLFEIKGGWLPDQEFTAGNTESMLQALRRRYGVSGSSRRGAVEQLARAFSAIAHGEWFGPADDFRAVKRVIPVVVAYDPMLAAPGFGSFVAAEFEKALSQCAGQWRSERPPTAGVRTGSPIVITVDVLELLETSLEHFDLRDALIDYSDANPDRMTSLRDFLASSPKYSDRIYANRFLASVTLDRLRTAKDRLFGQTE